VCRCATPTGFGIEFRLRARVSLRVAALHFGLCLRYPSGVFVLPSVSSRSYGTRSACKVETSVGFRLLLSEIQPNLREAMDVASPDAYNLS
jgi:hypothetical protein